MASEHDDNNAMERNKSDAARLVMVKQIVAIETRCNVRSETREIYSTRSIVARICITVQYLSDASAAPLLSALRTAPLSASTNKPKGLNSLVCRATF